MPFSFNNIHILGFFVEDTIIKRSTTEKIEKVEESRTISIGGPPLYMGFATKLIAKLYPRTGYPKIHSYIDKDLATRLRDEDYFPQEILDLVLCNKSPKFELSYLSAKEERKIVLRNSPNLYDASKFSLNLNIESAIIISSVFQEFNDSAFFEVLRKKCSFIALDPQGFFRKKVDDNHIRYNHWFDKKILTKVDCIKLSRNEANLLGVGDEPTKIIEELMKFGLKFVLITDGKFGSYFGRVKNSELNFEVFKIPAYLVEKTIDETGAGDVFYYTFIAFLYFLADEKAAIAYATSISSLLVEHRFNPEMYSFREIEKRKNETLSHIQLVRTKSKR